MNRKGVIVTGYILKEMASSFWDKLSQYSTLPKPVFSEGWLINFKARHAISYKRRYNEAATVDRIQLKSDLASIREELLRYYLNDIYNIDEIGLF